MTTFDKQVFTPMSGREHPRFSGIKTFFRLPFISDEVLNSEEASQKVDVALAGVPFDGGTSYRPGARFAPSRVREISSLGRGYDFHLQQSVFAKKKIADVGDCPINPINLEKSYEKIEAWSLIHLKKKRKLISVGGDHSITLPLLRSFKKSLKKPLALIHFDAHLDTYPAAWGSEFHHGTFLRHALSEGLVSENHVLQIGIRGPFSGESDFELHKKYPIQMITVDDVRSKSWSQIRKKINSFCKNASTLPTYISFDIDCLDPAYAPGTGTPVVGGLTFHEVQKIFRTFSLSRFVGGDLVEISPAYDHAEITSLHGVAVMFEMLSLLSQR